jgi:hypothetical protein
MSKRTRGGQIICRPVTGLKRPSICVIDAALTCKRVKHYEYWHHAELSREERAAHMAHMYANLIVSKN